MSTIKYGAYGTIATALSTELNSLANNARAISAAITGGQELWDDLELAVTYGTAPTAGSVVEIYLIPSVDGTNYVDGDATIVPPFSYLVGYFPLRAVTSAQRIGLRGVVLTPGLWKYLVSNLAGQSMAATGNTMKRRMYAMDST